jgi:hypothetical protein
MVVAAVWVGHLLPLHTERASGKAASGGDIGGVERSRGIIIPAGTKVTNRC